MLKNKIIVKKIRNIIILFMALIIMIGAYKNIKDSRAEDVIEIDAIAVDNYGYLENENFTLEAKEIGNNLYEIEIPESVNSKKINRTVKVTLEDSEGNATTEEATIIDNKVQLTKEQLDTKKINIELTYDVAILEKDENGQYQKILLSEKTEEERNQIQIAEKEVLYNKILRYEDETQGKLVELKGFLPKDAKLQVEEVTQEKLKEIFGDAKVEVAYDIKIIEEVVSQLPVDEANPDDEIQEIVETIEINPEDFGETCQVSIKDVNIIEDSQVYHVKEDNTYEQVNVIDSTNENISFEAKTFSLYAVSSDEGIMPLADTSSAPTWQFTETTFSDWRNNNSTLVGVEFYDEDGIATGNARYEWGTSSTTTATATSPLTEIDEAGSDTRYWYCKPYYPEGVEGTYYLGLKIYARDSLDNKLGGDDNPVYVTGGPYKIDTKAPTDPTYMEFVYSNWDRYTQGDWTNNSKGVYAVSHDYDPNAGIDFGKPEGSTDGGSGVAKYQISDDNSTWTDYSYSSHDPLYHMNTEGIHTRYFRAVDATGNASGSISRTAQIDYTAPTPASLTMKLGSSSGSNYTNNTWTNQSVYIALNTSTASDALSGVASSTYTVTKDGASYSSNRTSSLTLTAEGTYEIVVTTTDNAGNTATSSSYTVKIDKTKPYWSTQNISIDKTNQKVTVDLLGLDDLSGYKSNTLVASDISIYIDGTELTGLTKTLGTASTVTNGIKRTLTITGWEEAERQSGKAYKEWSGTVTIDIPAGKLTDNATNTNNKNTLSLGLVDVIKPEFTYKYSQADINYSTKTLKVVFSVVDKYFSSSTLTANDLTILIDGELPGDTNGNGVIDNGETLAITRTLTSNTRATNLVNGNITYKTNGDIYETIDGTERLIGKEYVLTISNLEQDEIADGKNYLDYSGIVTVSIPAGKIADSSGNTNSTTSITMGIDMPSTDESEIETTLPYLPDGYTQLSGTNLDTGIVIKDASGNQFVWVEVPRTTTVYPTAGLNITSFTDEEYTKIENDLHTYTNTYRNGTTAVDTDGRKKTILKSIYKNGGFYVGRYETGIDYSEGPRSSSDIELQNPVIKQNAYPYNYVESIDASFLAGDFASEGYGSSLMLGVQWDLILKYLETKGVAQSALITNSTSWGNYSTSTYSITVAESPNAKGSSNGNTWTKTPTFSKSSGEIILLTTGASNSFSKQNIYDLAGNLQEWTLEKNNSNLIVRGGHAGSGTSAVQRNEGSGFNVYTGFRVSLYKDEGTGADEVTDPGSNEAVIADVVDPIWTVKEISGNGTAITIAGTDKYLDKDKSALSKSDITVYVDGTAISSDKITLSGPTELTETRTVDGVSQQVTYGLQYGITLQLTDATGTYTTFTDTRTAGVTSKYREDNGGQITVEIAGETLVDQYDNKSKGQTLQIDDAEIVSPEFIYKYSNTTIGSGPDGNKKVTVVFDITDKRFSSSNLTVNGLTIKVGGVEPDWTKVTKTLSSHDLYASINSTETLVGKRYELVLENLDQGAGFDYSGAITIEFPAGIATDQSGNQNLAKTITIGIDEPEGTGSAEIVDVVDPVIEKVSATNNTTSKTQTIVFTAKDKYFNTADALQPGEITVKVNGETASSITKTLSSAEIKQTVDGVANTIVGYTYTLVLSDFEETERQTGKNFIEWSGDVSIEIPKGAVTDTSGNQNAAKTITGEFADFIKPKFTYKYSEADINKTNKTVKIVFSVTDKYYASTNTDLTVNDLTILIGGEAPDWTKVTKRFESITNITDTVNGTSGVVVGKEYTLLLENLEQSEFATGKNYLEYSGIVTVAIPAGKVADTAGNTNDAQTITMGIDIPNVDSSSDDEDTTGPYLPDGYTYVDGTDLDTGLVIEDESGNQYVWVEVPRTEEVYPTAGLDITLFTDDEYTLIKDDLQYYTAYYRNSTTFADTYYSDATTGLTSSEYDAQKKKMLKSIYKNGGFYVGRYETGISDNPRTSAGATLQSPVIKQNAYPYNFVTCSQAQTLAEEFATTGYETSLMFGVQWDLILKYLETKGTTQSILTNSSNWGNYMNTSYTIEQDPKGLIKHTNSATSTTWSSAKLNKASGEVYLLTTGASDLFNKQNISDLAGNVSEFTLEYSSDESNPCVLRGGMLSVSGATYPVVARVGYSSSVTGGGIGFRVSLYKDEGTGADEVVDPGSNEAVIADVVDPVWILGEVTQDKENNTATIKLRATDKYFKESTLTTDKITVYVNGEESTSVGKDITSVAPTDITDTVNGVADTVVGKEYTLILSDLDLAVGEVYETFTPSNLDEDQLDNTAGFKYRAENGGDIKIKIAEGTIEDNNANTSKEKELVLVNMDTTKPEVYPVQTIRNTSAKTETIIFNVTDKNYDSTDLVTIGEDGSPDEITVFVDGEQADNLTKTLSSKEIKITIGETTKIVGHQYTLVISGFEQSSRNSNNYKDWSGTVSIRIAANAAKDIGGNTLNTDTTTVVGDFVDFINPDVRYKYATGDIDKTGKKFTMVFDITDKYFKESTLATEYANATTDAERLTVLKNYLTIEVDGVDITNVDTVTKKITAITNVTVPTMNKTVSGTVQTGLTNQVIGKRFTLEISGLEQNSSTAIGNDYLDYSGVITVVVKDGTVTDNGPSGDNTNIHGNVETTITSGVNIPGGTNPDDAEIVDVVDPLWQQAQPVTENQESGAITIPLRVTDKYIQKDSGTIYLREDSGTKVYNLLPSDITVYVNGVVKTSADGVTVTVEEDTSTTLTYGKQYKVTVSGFASDATHVKITLRQGIVVDESGNGNKETSFALLSTLKVAKSTSGTYESGSTSGFLGETSISRQNIERVVFVNSTADSTATGVKKVWDVSAQNDNSIKAWYSETSAPYTVYIGSDAIMKANQDSSYLFSYIGYGTSCTATTVIDSLEKISTANVENMSYMFNYCGYRKMTTLNLGSNFNTDKVTNMSYMFRSTGYTAMTNLYFGDTTGTTGVITFPNSFNTTKVTNMSYMFQNFARGSNQMTSLDLGDVFYTTSATNMSNMFNGCGYTAMTTLDLGPAFANIPTTNTGFATNCGKSGAIKIYTGEGIYSNKNAFKLNTNSATTIGYTTGTIIPKYRPEWSKVSRTYDATNKTLTIVLQGKVNSNYSTATTKTVTNALTNGTVTANTTTPVNLRIDGVEANVVTKVISGVTTGAETVQATITLSGFEQGRLNDDKFKEWSGNVALQLAKGTLVDSYGNSNLAQTDENTGTMENIELKDTTTNKNTANKMFADFIKPEFTYVYAEADIDKTNKKVKVVFSVADKYYANTNTNLTVNDLTILIDGEEPDWAKVTKRFESITDITNTVNGTSGVVVGKEYTLLLENLEQSEIATGKNYLDYSGIVTVAIPAGKVADYSGNTNNAQTITMGIDIPNVDSSSDDEDTTGPYLPNGYTYVDGTDLDTGLVIEDSLGNQYVWVEVPKTTTVYSTAGLNITSFTDAEYTKIENDLHTYTSSYRSPQYVDEYSGDDASTGLTESEYNNLKKKMLKSIYKNGGFYIGRYETGTSDPEMQDDAVITQNAYPYNNVTCDKAQERSKEFATTGYTSSLMFGVQWDLVIKWLEDKIPQPVLITDSSGVGNYQDATYVISDSNVKYNGDRTIWQTAPYSHSSGSIAILSTGASTQFGLRNIYDLAGNLAEFTLESYTSGTNNVVRGGDCSRGGSIYPAVSRLIAYYDISTGFRVSLYKDEGTGADEGTGSNEAVIADVVDPVWTMGTLEMNATAIEVTMIGTDKYIDTTRSTLDKNKLTVIVDGTTVSSDKITLTGPTILKETRTIDSVSQEVPYGMQYVLEIQAPETSGSFVTFTDTKTSGVTSQYKDDSGGQIQITIAEGTLVDQSDNINEEQTLQKDNLELVSPEFIYKYSNTTIGSGPDGDKKVTVVFDVTDKRFSSTTLLNAFNEGSVEINVGGAIDWTKASKTLSKKHDLYASIDGTETKVGERYELVIEDLDQGLGFDYSGIMTIAFPAGIATDQSGNQNVGKTITIGIDEPEGTGSAEIVDVVDPVIEEVSAENGTDSDGKPIQTIVFTAKDKYFNTSNALQPGEITVKVNGETASSITKTLSSEEIKQTVDGVANTTVGYTYTLVLSNFEETEKQEGKSFIEWSGDVSIEIPKGAVTDTSGNQNAAKTINGTFADFIAPKIEKVSATNGTDSDGNPIQTIVFKATDKYLYTLNDLDASEITVYVDEEVADSVAKPTTTEGQEANKNKIWKELSSSAITATVDGVANTTVGYTYTLVLSNFEQTRTSINRNREFTDWSGTVAIKIAEGALIDKGPDGNANGDATKANKNAETKIDGVFADFIKPDVTYEYATGNIDYTGKTFTMVFDITDKYFEESALATEYANATTDAERLTVLKNYLTIEVDGVDITNVDTVTKKITAITNVTVPTMNKTVSGTVQTGLTNQVIGKRFTLEISGLEQNSSTAIGNDYLDYSGVITVVVKDEKADGTKTAVDTTGNGNVSTTITSGVNIPGGTNPDDAEIVDVVDPLWQQAGTVTGSSIDQTATIPLRVTDKYIQKDASSNIVANLLPSDITVYVNGVAKTSADGVTLTVEEDTSTILTYGKQYNVTVSGFASDAVHIKITLRQGIVVDESGNGNKATSFVLLSTLQTAKDSSGNNEDAAGSGFLGETSIQRQNIEKVVFVNSTADSTATGVKKVWDVSAQNDNSIKAWYSETSAPYTIYIGSDAIMCANQDSSYLFSYIGYGTNCTSTETISNLNLLNTNSVTNMSYMFNNCGYRAMTTLNLGNNFDISNVTNMSYMFSGTGYTAMTNLYFGDTTGTTGVITFPNSFNTANVTDMSGMFKDFGYSQLVTLNLGDNFYTNAVTNMSNMFNGCGQTLMTTLDLGPAFANIPTTNTGFATNCGKSGSIKIYTGEGIYSNKNAFKLNTNSATTIGYTTGTIIPKYRPEWSKVSRTYDATNKTLTIVLQGKVNSNYSTATTKTVTNTLTNGTVTANTTTPVNLRIDGVESNVVTKVISGVTTGAETVQATITLSGFEQGRLNDDKFKEWSGNVALQLAKGTLVDSYGNSNLAQTDENTGTMENIELKDTTTNKNTANTMFADFIKPEFTYEYSETAIDYAGKTLTVVFYAADKYFDAANSGLALSDLTFQVDGTTVDINVEGNSLDPEAVYDTDGTTRIGTKYTLVVKNLQRYQSTKENNQNDGYSYSGTVTIAIPANKFKDYSGNANDGKTITIGIDDPTTGDGHNSGVVVDVVDPVWQLGDIDLSAGTIKLIAKDKYFDTCTIDENKITVYVNGEVSAAVVKTLSAPITTSDGVEYTLTLSNITPEGDGELVGFEPSNKDTDNLVVDSEGYAYYMLENGGDISITIASGTIKDLSGNTSIEQSFNIGNIDAVKPRIYDVQKIQDASAGTLTFIFNVTDRNYDPLDLIELGEITVWVDGTQVTSIGKAFETGYPKPIKLNIDGETGKTLGHQYKLVLSNIVEAAEQEGKDYLEYSGTIEIRIAEDAAKDLKGNTLDTSTTTISDFVDYIKPVIKPVTVSSPINTTDKTYTMSFKVIDKYLDTTNMVTENEITVYVDGEEATSITKTLVDPPTPITAEFKKTVDGSVETDDTEHIIGYTYTLVLSNFEQAAKQSGKDFMEWSGTVKIEIAQNAVNDTTGNTLDSAVANRTVNGEYVDFIKPVVEKVSSTRGKNTETIVFNIMDKYLDTNDALEDTEISVYVDEELASNITKALTKVQDFKATVNGDSNHVVGQQYQLVLSGFEQSSRNANNYKDWSGTVSIELAQNAVKDTKGNVLDSDSTKRTVAGDFVDFINPDLQYTHQSTDISTGTKKYTMTFDITDKYYTSGQFTYQDIVDEKIEILMQNGQTDSDGNAIVYNLKDEPVTIAFSSEEIKVSSMKMTNTSGQVVTATDQVIGHTYTLTIENLEQLERKSGLTTADYSGVITVAVAGNEITDRGPSGDGTNANGNVGTTITSGVNIPGGTGNGVAVDVVDPIWERVSSSANAIDKTATITFKGTDTYFKESTLTSDKIEVYANGSRVTSGIVKDLSTATPLTETRIKNNGLGTTETETVQYGVQYTLTITGFAQDVDQLKIKIPAGTLKDETIDADNNVYNNVNKDTELILYNCLELTSSETAATNKFLDGDNETGIERQDIEKVIFVNSLDDVIDGDMPYIWNSDEKTWNIKSGIHKVWDVSAQGDDSILAWTAQTSAPYTVYIGSEYEIFANQISSYLFSYIGYGTNCDETEVVTNLNLLNTNSVKDMSYMFNNFGYRAMRTFNLGAFDTADVTNMTNMFNNCGNLKMPELNLGTSFDTSNVTDMSNMFNGCGQAEMTTLNLGNSFNTSNVQNISGMFQNCGQNKLTILDLGATGITFNTSSVVGDMSNMFNGCGQNAMTTFSLGSNFNTAQVTNMSGMFQNFGQKLESLNLGAQFNTSAVTDMSNMFNGCGLQSMKTLNLGANFNTANVENMSGMFQDFAKSSTQMTSLDLGNLFYTTSATDMRNMFNGCGLAGMTSLDLGPAFTRIPDKILDSEGNPTAESAHTDFMANCGTSSLVIYAPESIYLDKESLKLNKAGQ